MYRSRRSLTSGLSGIIFVIGLILAFSFGGFSLPIFFVALAFASLIGSISSFNPRGVYGGIQGFVWLIGLAFCFQFGFWPGILIVVIASSILGSLMKPIMAGLLGANVLGMSLCTNQQQTYYQPQQQPYYQPPQPQQPPYQPYGQGYQPQQPETYQEGGQQHQYSPEQPSPAYDQPQAEYPQQMPPQMQ